MIKLLFAIGSLVLALIPTWIFLLVKNLLEPEGFWQNLVVYGVGVYFLGAIQLLLIFIWIGFVIHMLTSYKW